MKRHDFLRILPIAMALCLGFCNLISAEAPADRKIKVAVVYSATSPQLRADTEGQIRRQLGPDVEMLIYQVPDVLQETLDAGHVTTGAAARLFTVYMKAIEDGADAILSVCSTVGDAAHSMKGAAEYLGVPILIINEDMCREAVRQGKRIAIMATLQSSINPTKNIITRVARELGRHDVEIVEVLVEGGYGLEPEKFRTLMETKAKEIDDQVDVIIFSQGSMAYCERHVADVTGKPVLSNPYFGAQSLKNALIAKGLISE